MTTNRFLGFISFELVKSHWEAVRVDSFPPGFGKSDRDAPFKATVANQRFIGIYCTPNPGKLVQFDEIRIFFRRGWWKTHQLGMFWVLTFLLLQIGITIWPNHTLVSQLFVVNMWRSSDLQVSCGPKILGHIHACIYRYVLSYHISLAKWYHISLLQGNARLYICTFYLFTCLFIIYLFIFIYPHTCMNIGDFFIFNSY